MISTIVDGYETDRRKREEQLDLERELELDPYEAIDAELVEIELVPEVQREG